MYTNSFQSNNNKLKQLALGSIVFLAGCSTDSWTVKPEWMGYKDTPYIECPRDFIQVKVLSNKWQCQPMVWWGLEEQTFRMPPSNPYFR